MRGKLLNYYNVILEKLFYLNKLFYFYDLLIVYAVAFEAINYIQYIYCKYNGKNGKRLTVNFRRYKIKKRFSRKGFLLKV